MNPCPHSERAGAYHDGEMTPQARADFEAHLAACESCSRQLGRLQQLTALLQGVQAPAVEEQLIERLHAHVDTLPQIGAVRRLAQALAATAAGIIVVCTVALAQGNGARGETPAAWEADALTPPTTEAAQAPTEDATAAWVLRDLTGKD
ncbi:MAG: zf-HC2 domain-containing protein [Planctomycetaceae bacterium]|nr:zf-HC2 domain-containing protein [Planctomycetaceae bacterium]